MKTSASFYKKKSEMFKALGHPTRLTLAHKLVDGDLCVTELNKFFNVEQPTLSRHLSVLKKVGILESNKKGMQVFYSLKTPCLLKNILECVESIENN